MRRNMSGNLGLYKYLWPGSVADSTFFNTNATLLTSEMIISELTNKP